MEKEVLYIKEIERLRKDTERYRDAYNAACAFIDSHVADPDITQNMVEKYAEFMRHRDAIDAAIQKEQTK